MILSGNASGTLQKNWFFLLKCLRCPKAYFSGTSNFRMSVHKVANNDRYRGCIQRNIGFGMHQKCSFSMQDNSLTKDDPVKDAARNSNCSHNGSSLERLNKLKEFLENEVKHFFTKRMEYRAYSKDLVFENLFNLNKPSVAKGLTNYAIAAMKTRLYMNFLYPKSSISVLEAHVNEQEHSVDVHWVVNVLKHSALLNIKKASPFNTKESLNDLASHIYGISTFYVNKDGFIEKHVLRKVLHGRSMGGKSHV